MQEFKLQFRYEKDIMKETSIPTAGIEKYKDLVAKKPISAVKTKNTKHNRRDCNMLCCGAPIILVKESQQGSHQVGTWTGFRSPTCYLTSCPSGFIPQSGTSHDR